MSAVLLLGGETGRSETQPVVPDVWVLEWNDEFDGAAGSGVDTTRWIYDVGTGYGCPACPSQWGTGEVETMSSSTSTIFHDGAGHLAIMPIHTGAVPTSGWTSGRIETVRTDFEPLPGGQMAVEASIQQPNVSGSAARGYWPAFWMLGAPFRGNYLNWPSIGEIDVMEDVNGLGSEFATLHCGSNPGGPCNEPTGITSGRLPCAGCQNAFHTYRVELDRRTSVQQIRWYLDGTNVFTVTSDRVDAATWDYATNHGFFVILDVAIGGGFPEAFGGGPTASTVSGVPMLVDYVRIYYAGAEETTSTTTTTATTTTAPRRCGDVNADGAVGVGDALVVAQFDVGLRLCGVPPFQNPSGCDVNGDGACNIGDALRIAQCDVGLIGCTFSCRDFACH